LVAATQNRAPALAVAAGAAELSPVDDEHGWRIGRVVDPFGHEREIGKPDRALAAELNRQGTSATERVRQP
jgi:uncharacterized glyoxalase superfamily protein PhnB